ncbi:hypothetical protein [Sphingomonas prati]|uniref:Uncharacterized protein n=1 Tax=Sphingomonas prati TaxID=1843237 RepID=A0A7W9F1Z1_9SPHN|nr:hypothetical protein [Sphingomonas prati]MBB5729828.1 hypothetical protein [Sphingomonas prati]GGE89205.1 hypothetical protein GCM10011404_22570 [Sphingomonas prati]
MHIETAVRARREILAGLSVGALTAVGGLGLLGGCGATAESAPPQTPSALKTGYDRVYRDMYANWWDSKGRVVPARTLACVIPPSGGQKRWGLPAIGEQPALWMEESYHNFLYWHWKATGSAETARMIASQWDCTRAQFGAPTMAGDGRDATIYASDDAGWVAQYLAQVFEVTKDRSALNALRTMIPATLKRFRDPFTDPVKLPGFSYSRYGILYALPGGDPAGQGTSSVYEVPLAIAALTVFETTRDVSYLQYAVAIFALMQAHFRQSDGVYWGNINIDLRRKPYLVSTQAYFGPPQQGVSAVNILGSMAMGVLAARLYRVTRRREYAAQAATITKGMLKPGIFLHDSTNGFGKVFLSISDPWTDAFFASAFATEVLPLPGTDPDGAWAAALGRTARSILAQRVEGGFYGGNWGGILATPNANGNRSYEEQAAKANDGAGGGQAIPQQIMTSANSASMVQAAMLAER